MKLSDALLPITLLLHVFSYGQTQPVDTITYNESVERSGLFFKKGSDIPFTGVVATEEDGFKIIGTIKNGKAEGLMTKWYENGKKRSETNIKDGKREGLHTDWHDNGLKEREGNYVDNERLGVWTEWYKNGQKQSEGKYISNDESSSPWLEDEGVRDGKWTYWYENGQKAFEGNYKDRKKEGLHTTWHENGQKEKEGEFVGGEPEGLHTTWHADGSKIEEGNYLNGKKEGIWKEIEQERDEILTPQELKQMEEYYARGEMEKYAAMGNLLFEGKYISNEREGTWTSKFKNGKRRLEQNYSKGKSNGLWTLWWENGHKREEGNYKNENKDGAWSYWFENGQIAAKENYKDGDRNGLWIWYHAIGWKTEVVGYVNGEEVSRKDLLSNDINLEEIDGLTYHRGTKKLYTGIVKSISHAYVNNDYESLAIEGNYVNGKKEGHWNAWYDNGKKATEGKFVNNKEEGLWITWRKNGEMRSKGNYKNGNKDGQWTEWHDRNNPEQTKRYAIGEIPKSSEGNHVNGIKEGLHTTWHINGLKEREGNYVDDVRIGVWTEWYMNGQKKSEGNYISNDGSSSPWLEDKGVRDGKWTYWHENGQKATEGKYVNNKEEGLWIIWRENGELESKGNYKNGDKDGQWTAWHDRNNSEQTKRFAIGEIPKSSEGNYVNGKEEGLHIYWDENGQKWFEVTYVNGKKEGVANGWHANGRKSREENYINDRLTGVSTSWHDNGQKLQEGKYTNGEIEGLWTMWYDNGQKLAEVNYINHKQEGLCTYWFRDGNKESENYFENGILKRYTKWGWYETKKKKNEKKYAYDEKQMKWKSTGSTTWNKEGNESKPVEEVDLTSLETHPRLGYKIKNNKPFTGVGLTFFDNGIIEIEEPYKEGALHGARIKRFESGQKEEETNYVYGKKEGTYTMWHKDFGLEIGSIERGWIFLDSSLIKPDIKGEFVSNTMNGVWTSWYGHYIGQIQKQEEIRYWRGVEVSIVRWYENGKKEYEGSRKGVKKWDENGKEIDVEAWPSLYADEEAIKKLTEAIPINGVNFEELTEHEGIYYISGSANQFTGLAYSIRRGHKISEGNFLNGKLSGLRTEWYPNGGRKKYEATYAEGEPTEGTIWYPNGQKQEEFKIVNRNEVSLTKWYENGHKKEEGHTVNGKREGLHVYWFSNGQKSKQGKYVNGKGEGLFTTWYDNGQKESEGNYVNEKQEGLWTYWHKDGKKRLDAEMLNGRIKSQKRWDESTFLDIDNVDFGNGVGKTKVVVIDNQQWICENLNVDRFANGDPIPEAKTVEEWTRSVKEKRPAWCYYNNDPANGHTYGKLYNWYAVNDPRGLAPAGWHVPSHYEWTELTDYLGGEAVAGTEMKSVNGWENNGNGNNSSGFNCLPGGARGPDGLFNAIGKLGIWWSTDIIRSARSHSIGDGHGGVNFIVNSDKGNGFSVRCVRDRY